MLSGDLLAYQKGLISVNLMITRAITQNNTLTTSSPVTVSLAAINQRHHPLKHLNHYCQPVRSFTRGIYVLLL
jgi:hypothetical protein